MNRNLIVRISPVVALVAMAFMSLPNKETSRAGARLQTSGPAQVQSVALSRAARAGNERPGAVHVVVQSADGLVTGLTLDNFTARALQAPPGGSSIRAVRVHSSGGGRGIYLLDIVPTEGGTWMEGDYVISTSVHGKSLEGASLAILSIPPKPRIRPKGAEPDSPIIRPRKGGFSISGRVQVSDPSSVRNFQVLLDGPSGLRGYDLDASGRYRFSDLPAGNYKVWVDTRKVEIFIKSVPPIHYVNNLRRDRGDVDFKVSF